MPTTLNNIKGRDLQPAWKQEAGIADDETVSITITRQRAKLVHSRPARRPVDMDKINAILARVHAAPVLDDRTADEIIGYDEFGLPK